MTRWLPSEVYPDPAIEILDKRFANYRLMNASVERLASGTRWGEGPVWFGDSRSLFWSDIPNNRILRWDEASGRTSVFRAPSGFANGNTRDRSGRLITCEHGGRRRMTSLSNQTGAFGLRIRLLAFRRITRGPSNRRSCRLVSIGSTPSPDSQAWLPMMCWGRTGSVSRRTSASCMLSSLVVSQRGRSGPLM